VFNARTSDLGQSAEQVSGRSRKLVTADKSTIVTETLFDAVVMKDDESDGRLPDPASTDEGDGYQVFGQANDLVDQFVASKTGSRRPGRPFTRCARCNYKISDISVAGCANLA